MNWLAVANELDKSANEFVENAGSLVKHNGSPLSVQHRLLVADILIELSKAIKEVAKE